MAKRYTVKILPGTADAMVWHIINHLPTPLPSTLYSVTFKWDDVFWHPEYVSVFIKPAGTITDADFEHEAKEVVLSRRDLRV